MRIMIECPETKISIDTGLTARDANFAEHIAGQNAVGCPHCGDLHDWSPKEAWLENEDRVYAKR